MIRVSGELFVSVNYMYSTQGSNRWFNPYTGGILAEKQIHSNNDIVDQFF